MPGQTGGIDALGRPFDLGDIVNVPFRVTASTTPTGPAASQLTLVSDLPKTDGTTFITVTTLFANQCIIDK